MEHSYEDNTMSDTFLCPALVDLSRPFSSVFDFQDALRFALSCQVEEEREKERERERDYDSGDSLSAVKAIILQLPRQALVFLNNPSRLLERIRSHPTIPLGGSVTATFNLSPDCPTEFIELQLANSSQLNSIVREIQALPLEPPGFQQIFFYCRFSTLLVRLQSSSLAKSLLDDFSTLSGVNSSNLVTLNDHCCLDSRWSSKLKLEEVTKRLKRTGETLCSVLQGILSLLPEQPCLLGVHISLKNETLKDEYSSDLTLVCCTHHDAEIIRNLGCIELGSIGKLVLQSQLEIFSQCGSISSDDETHASESVQSKMSECILFWDLDTFPLPKSTLLNNFSVFEQSLRQLMRLSGVELLQSGNYMFLTDPSIACRNSILGDISRRFEVICMTHRIGTVTAMKKEIDSLIRRSKDKEKKYTICCVTLDIEFKTILNNLSVEGYSDWILCSYTGVPSPLVDIAPKSLSWEIHEVYQDILEEDNRNKKKSNQGKISNDKTEFNHSLTSSRKDLRPRDGHLESKNIPSKPLSSREYFFKSVRVSRFSMAAHLNNLIKWKDEDPTFLSADPLEDVLYDNDAESQIEVSIDRDKRKQKIIVSGESEESVKSKVTLVENLLAQLASNRKVLRMHGWKAPHREAMMGSIPLNNVSQMYRTTVVFHVTDGHIVSEMMSTSEIGILRMSEYLKSLQPLEAKWKFETRYLIPEPRIRFWNSIRNKYAVMFEKSVVKGMLEVQAWGFGSLLQDVFTEVQSAAAGRPIPPTTILSHPAQNTPAVPDKSNGITCDNLQIAEYRFKDSDAAQFYLTYEDMYQRFLAHSFRVSVSIAPISLPREVVMNECLILDIRGRPDDISATTNYLDYLRHDLNCREVLISSADEKTYIEIEELKDNYLRGFVQEAIRLTSQNEDPLNCPGLISIRVVPPQGLKKLNFPINVTVYVCESSNTAQLHGNRSGQSPKMKRILDQFHSLSRVDKFFDWTPCTLTAHRGLIVEPPMFDHVADSTSLSDYVSEDVKQWLSSMSSPVSPLSAQFSLAESLLDSDSFISPRKSYTDVVKSSVGPPSILPSLSTDSEVKNEPYKRTVHWPHSSFRYMFLGERMKKFIHETVQKIQSRSGDAVAVTCPYRDKKDASVCILLEGPQSAVDDAVILFNQMLAGVLEELRCMTLILSGTQYSCLTAQDLGKVKAIQGSAGVHVMLNPNPTDHQNSIATIDLRHLENSLIKADEIVRVRIPGFNKRQVDISVMSAPAEAPGWTWGVSTLFAVLEKDDDCGLTKQEVDKLNHGEVLVTSDFESRKTILRARISTPSHSSSTMIRSLSGMPTEKLLSNVISRGLAQADILAVNGIAVIAPDTLTELSSLGSDRIRTVTVSSIVDHVRTHQLFHLDRIVCLEVIRPNTSFAGPYHSVMAETLCRLIKDSNETKVTVCNDPTCSAIVGKKKYESLNDTTHTIILKGIEECLQTSLEEIKEIIAR